MSNPTDRDGGSHEPPKSKRLQPAAASPTRRWKAEDLFAGQQRVVIEHQGHDYVLLITRRGGLVLNLMT